jgi:hypothetical protein
MDEYIQQLLQDAGLPESTDPEVREQLTMDLTARANDLMNRRLIDAMSDEDAEAFDKLLDEQPENIEAMQQFITDHVSNREQVVGAALLEFRALYLGASA